MNLKDFYSHYLSRIQKENVKNVFGADEIKAIEMFGEELTFEKFASASPNSIKLECVKLGFMEFLPYLFFKNLSLEDYIEMLTRADDKSKTFILKFLKSRFKKAGFKVQEIKECFLKYYFDPSIIDYGCLLSEEILEIINFTPDVQTKLFLFEILKGRGVLE